MKSVVASFNKNRSLHIKIKKIYIIVFYKALYTSIAYVSYIRIAHTLCQKEHTMLSYITQHCI